MDKRKSTKAGFCETLQRSETSPDFGNRPSVKNRLSLRGTAILERENQPVLAASYQYLTEQAELFFEGDVEGFQNIELSKIAFGVSAYRDRGLTAIEQLDKGTVYKAAGGNDSNQLTSSSSPSTSNYMWALNLDKSESQANDTWISSYNNFICGFLSCMMLCMGMGYFLII